MTIKFRPGIYLVAGILLSILAGTAGLPAQNQSGLLSGEIVNQATGEPLANCTVLVKPSGTGTTSDSLGLFVLPLPYGKHTIEFRYLGFQTAIKHISLSAAAPKNRLKIKLSPIVLEGEEVTVVDRGALLSTTVQQIDQADIRRMPTLYSDVLRTLKILPGVSSNNELSSAYNVRGGNFDENLIYLNGYEIYRPFLLRQGVEESQSLINPDMVEDIRFHGGAFPVTLGDKLSSALEVNYQGDHPAGLRGSARVDLFNGGLQLRNRHGKLSWMAGVRYANPGLFVDKLQTSGNYRPLFADGQLLIKYAFSSNAHLELFALNAYNRFDLTPENWTGNFKFNILDVKAVNIAYDGERKYSFHSGLLGLRYHWEVSPQTRFSISASGHSSLEEEYADISGDIVYVEDARNPHFGGEFIKTRTEQADNRLDLQTYEVKSSLQKHFMKHTLTVGAGLRSTRLDNSVDELFMEEGEEALRETPLIEQNRQHLDLTHLSGYVQDMFMLGEKWRANLGARAFYYSYNEETLISPRASLHFYANAKNTLNLSWGYYYQPPFFYEFRNRDSGADPLKSQKAVHTILGWEYRFKENLKWQIEAYHKKLDQLIPYYLDELKLVYENGNSNEGYAYGLDMMIQGQIVKSVNSWISYSYLKTRERPIASGESYRRRLLDQSHTVRIFLQDKVPQHPHIQVHTRLLFGSGYLYHPRNAIDDEASGETFLAVDFQRIEKFQHYARVDLGLSGRFKIGKKREIVVVGEILNMFNNINVAAYSWFQIFPGQPVRTPRVYTRRFFNLGIEASF